MSNLICCRNIVGLFSHLNAYISAYVIDLTVLGTDLIKGEMYIRASR